MKPQDRAYQRLINATRADLHRATMDADPVTRRVARTMMSMDDWDESKHPRGKGGKFAPKGTAAPVGGSGGGSSSGSSEAPKAPKIGSSLKKAAQKLGPTGGSNGGSNGGSEQLTGSAPRPMEKTGERFNGKRPGNKGAAQNRKALEESNRREAQACLRKAQQWPAGSQERHMYEMYADIFSKPMATRPTPEESKALTQKFLGNISTKLKPAAVERYKSDLANEPQITSDLCDIADEIGTGMYGLGFRLKKASDSSDGGCRIADKIAEDMEDKKCSYEKAVAGLSDMVRYTQACTLDNMVDNFHATDAALRKKGYEPVKIKNSWNSYSVERPYRGVNCVYRSPSGTLFELQFHTAESLAGKEVQHGQYEEQRKPETPLARKQELGRIMYKNMSSLTAPRGIENIKQYP